MKTTAVINCPILKRFQPVSRSARWLSRSVVFSTVLSTAFSTLLAAALGAAVSGTVAADNDEANNALDSSGLDVKQHAGDLLYEYCERCHNDGEFAGNWSIYDVNLDDIALGADQASWEKILRVTRRGEMPPADKPQPGADSMLQFTSWLESSLDDYIAANPNPGRATLRRLNRSEYSNAVRDLLALDMDFTDALPGDDSGYGFDNNADILTVSSTLMERYITVAGKISRTAVGITGSAPSTTTYNLPKDGSIQNQGVPSFDIRMSDDLPIDSRGGGEFRFYAPHPGIYEVSGFLNANTNNEVDRFPETRVSQRFELEAGQHLIGLAFRKSLALDERVQILRNDTNVNVWPDKPPEMLTLDFVLNGERAATTQVPSYHMSDRFSQTNFLRDLMQIDVTGPLEILSSSDIAPKATASQQKIFICTPAEPSGSEYPCAKEILSNLAKQAYRRPVTEQDIDRLMAVFDQGRMETDFETGIATAIQAMLVSPSFLYLHEGSPAEAEPGSIHQISDREFAARLALFLWSSLPDQELADLADADRLREPGVLEQQISRMLADKKANAITTNFAGQWLYLRNLQYHYPDIFEFPDFNVPLRQAMQRETEMFFASILRDNRSVFDFISADYSYLNQRLAEHYGIEGVKGTAFRKVELSAEDHRGGLLGQASILTVTSYANHTSPVRRGKWILDNLLAATPPPPPPDVPSLIAEHNGKQLTAKEQMALHRADPACASCHLRMDPLGLSLEKYDAVGAFREYDAGTLIDAMAVMPDGTEFDGLPGLKTILDASKEQFAEAFIERLLTYALGRGLEAYDQPAIRAISREASQDNYQIHSIVLAIANSQPFNLRRVPET